MTIEIIHKTTYYDGINISMRRLGILIGKHPNALRKNVRLLLRMVLKNGYTLDKSVADFLDKECRNSFWSVKN